MLSGKMHAKTLGSPRLGVKEPSDLTLTLGIALVLGVYFPPPPHEKQHPPLPLH